MSVKYTVYKPHVHGTAPALARGAVHAARRLSRGRAGTRLECTKAVALATYGSLLYPDWHVGPTPPTRIFRPQGLRCTTAS